MVKINGNDSSKTVKAKVKYQDKFDGQFPGEVLIVLNTLQGTITAIFSASLINETGRTIDAFIIDESEDSYLVDLPTYTFTSGSRAWFAKKLVTTEV